MFSTWQRFRRLLYTAIEWWVEIIALILLLIGFVGYFRGANLYVPIFTEVIGIGLAVLLIDTGNKWLATRQEKKRLILQMGSPDNAFAREAVRQLSARGWLKDGSLQGANLREADLSRAPLFRADLMGAYLMRASLMEADLMEADLMEADLREAMLMFADLANAILWDADLANANLEYANLIGADLKGANLENANLEDANLMGANVSQAELDKALSLEGATMPDGTVYKAEDTEENQEDQ